MLFSDQQKTLSRIFESAIAYVRFRYKRFHEYVTAEPFKCKPPEVHFTIRNRGHIINNLLSLFEPHWGAVVIHSKYFAVSD